VKTSRHVSTVTRGSNLKKKLCDNGSITLSVANAPAESLRSGGDKKFTRLRLHVHRIYLLVFSILLLEISQFVSDSNCSCLPWH